MLHRPQDEAAGGVDAADDLDDDVGPGHEVVGIGGEEGGVDGHVGARTLRPPDGDADELERRADPGGEVVGVLDEQARDGGPHHTAAEQGHAQGGTGCVRHGGVQLLGSRSSRVRHVEGEQVIDGLTAHEHP